MKFVSKDVGEATGEGLVLWEDWAVVSRGVSKIFVSRYLSKRFIKVIKEARLIVVGPKEQWRISQFT